MTRRIPSLPLGPPGSLLAQLALSGAGMGPVRLATILCVSLVILAAGCARSADSVATDTPSPATLPAAPTTFSNQTDSPVTTAASPGRKSRIVNPSDTRPVAKPVTKESPGDAAESPGTTASQDVQSQESELETITLGAGCFWCIEAVLKRLDGVKTVVSGYMGGSVPNPTYKQVCTGLTGHAEVVQVTFDPRTLPLDDLLDYFWQLHDPTTLNRQGADVGTQYRSAIFYHNQKQQQIAEASKAKWGKSGKFQRPIVTEISPASEFYPAEDYHQDFYARNPGNPYCRFNIPPKLRKLKLD